MAYFGYFVSENMPDQNLESNDSECVTKTRNIREFPLYLGLAKRTIWFCSR